MNHREDADASGEAFAAALRTGDWSGAQRHLRQAKARGLMPLAWALRESDWYMAQQRWDEAMSHLKSLLAVAPESEAFQLALHHNLASIAYVRRDFAGAVAWLSPLLDMRGAPRILPQGFLATQILWVRSLHRSCELARLHRWVMQLEAFAQLDPHVAGAASLAGWDMADFVAAARWSTMARTNIPPVALPAESLVTAALLALSNRRPDEARALAAAAVAREPGESRALAALGFSQLALGEAKTSARTFQAATGEMPQAAAAWRGQAWAQLLSAELEAAHASFISAVALDDRHAENHGGLAVVLATQRRAAEAGERIARCLILDPESKSARHAEGILRGDTGHALDLGALVAALINGPRDSWPINRPSGLKAPAALRSPRADFKIAVVTPTLDRPRLLVQTLRYFLAQDVVQPENLHWFVLDDSSVPSNLSSIKDSRIHYRCLPRGLALGAKRNQLNDMAREWGADFICSMDDDDWYGPSYVRSMVDMLQQQPGRLFAGSSQDYYYHVPSGKILRVGASGPGHSCNGVLCYRATALDGRRYDASSRLAEEPSFLRGAFVAQHPDIREVHLALAHAGNTVDKSPLYRSRACHTELTLAQLPMQPDDQAFYRALTVSARLAAPESSAA